MRHSIETAWIRGNTEYLNSLFGHSTNPEKGKPTNSEFLALMAMRMRDEMKEETQT